MGEQEAAAGELEAAAADAARFVEECPDSDWLRPTAAEGWTVAALLYHCAVGSDVALGWVCQMLAARPVRETPVTHNAANLVESERNQAVTKSETLAALDRSTRRTAAFLRALTDEELGRTANHGLAGRDLTVGAFLPNFGRHVRGHLASAREAVAR